MDSDPIVRGVQEVTKRWTRQRKAEERGTRSRASRDYLWSSRTSLKEICEAALPEAWAKASGGGSLPTHWRQIFYVMRPLCDSHPDSDRPLIDAHFKNILEKYLEDFAPGWDVLRGARGVFKEPHAAMNDNGLPMSTMGVRNYLHDRVVDARIMPVAARYPTKGAHNRIAAVLICEKEGFDELLMAEQIPEKHDIALMSTKGISAKAARDLAEGLGVPCFTLHDMDKNGFVMAAGFPFATDIGLRMADVEEWNLAPEEQEHRNETTTYKNLRKNGATEQEATFIASGQRVELNMLTGPEFIEFVERKLDENGVEKVVPDQTTLKAAWKRAHVALKVNKLIYSTWPEAEQPESESDDESIAQMPDDIAESIRAELDTDPAQSWDEVLWTMIGGGHDEDEDES